MKNPSSLTTKAGPPLLGKALIVKNLHTKKITQLLSSWSDPGLNITKDLVVGPTPHPPRSKLNNKKKILQKKLLKTPKKKYYKTTTNVQNTTLN